MPRQRPDHCPAGHPYSGRNLRITPDNRRHCRECDNERRRPPTGRKAATNPWYDQPAQRRRKERLRLRERYRDDGEYRALMIERAAEYHAEHRPAILAERRARYRDDGEYRARHSRRMQQWYAEKVGRPVRPCLRVRKRAS